VGVVRDSAGNLYGTTGSGTGFKPDTRYRDSPLHRSAKAGGREIRLSTTPAIYMAQLNSVAPVPGTV
jgi:hypothetical protein